MALLETFTDNFDGAALDAAKWTPTASAVTTTVSGGTLNFTTSAGRPINSYAAINSVGTYQFADSSAFVKLIFPAGSGQNVWFTVKGGVSSGQYFRFVKVGGVLQFLGYDGGYFANTQMGYDPVAMLWLRLRNTAGTTYWETSPDATNWTIRSSSTYALKDTAYRVELYTYWSAVSTFSVLSFDNLNVDPPPPVLTYPDSVIDAETVGSPTGPIKITANPDSVTDPETLGDPTGPIIVTPVSIIDTDTVGAPTIEQEITAYPDGITDTDTVSDPTSAYPPIGYPDSITDPETLGAPEATYGLAVTEPCAGNLYYGIGDYNCDIYWGWLLPDRDIPPLFADTVAFGPPMHILGIGPWSPRIQWRGIPNRGINAGQLPARPALALPPATSKGFTLRLNEGSEARTDIAMRRGDAVIIDEMDTDLWWRRKDPRTGTLEMIGRFNCNNIELATSDTGVNQSAQWEDYSTVLGARLILKYLTPNAPKNPTTMWDTDTLVTDILAWALPTNLGLDLSEVSGPTPYPLGGISQPYHLPLGTEIATLMDNLEALSRNDWEWWIETPADVNKAPKLRFILGTRGQDKGVTLFDVGSGPSPIASWIRNGAADNYANNLHYYTSDDGTNPGGGVVEAIPAEIEQFGERDAEVGASFMGGDLGQIRKGAEKKLKKLSDRTPTYTITLAQGYWRGREHIDIGDTVRIILRLGKELINAQYRITEINVDIDDNNLENVTLTLGKPKPSADPRSRRSPVMRMLRTLKNYTPPPGNTDPPENNT